MDLSDLNGTRRKRPARKRPARAKLKELKPLHKMTDAELNALSEKEFLSRLEPKFARALRGMWKALGK